MILLKKYIQFFINILARSRFNRIEMINFINKQTMKLDFGWPNIFLQILINNSHSKLLSLFSLAVAIDRHLKCACPRLTRRKFDFLFPKLPTLIKSETNSFQLEQQQWCDDDGVVMKKYKIILIMYVLFCLFSFS